MKINQSYEKRNTIIVCIIGVFILGWVLFRIIFPVFVIISDDHDNYLIRDIGGKKFLELKLKKRYPFHKVKIVLTARNNTNNKVTLKNVYQNELALYDQGREINSIAELKSFLNINNTLIQNGELIQRGNFVYFVSKGTYRAFSNAETFDALGFDWTKVQKSKSDDLMKLKKGDIIMLTTAYFPGEFVQIDKELYLLGDRIKHRLNNVNKDLIKYVVNNFSIIKVDKDRLQSVGRMSCRDGYIHKKIVCKFKDSKQRVFPLATVLISTNKGIIDYHGHARVGTFDGLSSVVPKITIQGIKERLLTRYGERVGINLQ